jgi:nucleotide-binding universal stress UspA family protein
MTEASGELVVCYDGSDGARGALAKAIELSSALGAGIVVAYGYDVGRLGGDVMDLADALRERGELVTEDGLAAARAAGVEARAVVLEGSPAAVIAAFAEAEGAAMIVSGTRGERPLTGAIVGSVPHKLLHVSTLPVLAVPQ